MRIGIVCYPTIGGSGVVATELGHALANQGHEVHFITYAIPFRLRLEEKNIYFHEVEINQYDLFQYPDYALPLAVKIASVAHCYNLDILHVHYAIPHATSAYLAKKILDTPKRPLVITTLHGTDITLVGSDPAYYQIVKFSIEQSDCVTAVSKSLAAQTQEYFGVHKPIELIYNFFVPKNEYLAKKPTNSNFVTGEEKLLVHASNYRPLKRSMDVLKIFMEIRRVLPVKLLFVGTGPEIGLIKKSVIEQHLEKEVFFAGATRNIDSYIACSDLLLLPSEQESFGLVALEAMAYGVPVVASNAGGLPEVVQGGETGFLLPHGDIHGMAEASIMLLKDHTLYEQFSAAGRKLAEEMFSADKIVPEYEQLYRRMLGER